MLNRILIKTFVAGAALNANQLVKFGVDDNTVIPAAAATDSIVGATGAIAANSGDMVDVTLIGVEEASCGGNVTRGDLVTSDANGTVVTAAPAAGSNARIVGIAMASGVAGDIIGVLLMPASMQG